ncbi:MAG TPA: ATP-grasp domain-containing protein [Flavobacterium sp.]|nr:ATP-grasp domain-containing protein [Flavobacterium sp.]
MKKVIILGGGNDQVPLIKEFNQRGYSTIVIDYFENPPAKPYVTKHFIGSSHSVEYLESIVSQEKPDVITSIGNDPVIPIIAEVCEKFNFINTPIDYKSSLCATNKELMKSVFVENNIPTSTSFNLTNINLSTLNYPVVIKPKKGTSSRGVFRFDNKNELQVYLNNESNLGNIIAEEFIDGDEISVDCIVVNGKSHVINTTQLFQIPNLESNFSFLYTQSPYTLENNLNKKIEKIAEKIAKAFHIKFGPFFFQAKVNSNEVSVIEMGARIAGGNKAEFIKIVTGYDVIKNSIDLLEGLDGMVPRTSYKSYYSKVHVYGRKGKVNKIEYKVTPSVLEITTLKKAGDILEGGVGAKDRVLSVTVVSDSPEQLKRNRLNFIDSVRILDDENEDLTLREYFYEN